MLPGNSSNPPSGAEAAGGAQSSIFGSIGMMPAAAVGLGQLVSKVRIVVHQSQAPQEKARDL